MKRAYWSVLLVAASTMVVAASPGSDLDAYIASEPALTAVYDQSASYWSSTTRAEALVEHGANRHALVMYKSSPMVSGLGQKLCHSALSRKERDAWLDELAGVTDGDRVVAQKLADFASPVIRIKAAEYSSLGDWNSWKVGACVVPALNISTTYPAIPDAPTIRIATYEVGKQLYAQGYEDQALKTFKTLKNDPSIYADAILFVVAILQATHPEIAKALNDRHVNLAKAKDPDALKVYQGYLSEVE